MSQAYWLDVRWDGERDWVDYMPEQVSLKVVLGHAKSLWQQGHEAQIWDERDRLVWRNGKKASPFDCLSAAETEWLRLGGTPWPSLLPKVLEKEGAL